MARTRILLADDHKEIRDRVVRLLEPEFDIVGVVEDGYPVLEATSRMKPDICIMDISMPVLGGLDAAIQLRNSGLEVKVIFLTVHDDHDFLQAALDTGAWPGSSSSPRIMHKNPSRKVGPWSSSSTRCGIT